MYAADVGNAYLNAPCREKIWFEAGPEFGEDQGTIMVIKKALYGLKSSGASWRAMLAELLVSLKYISSKADPDVWMRRQTKPNGDQYYEMVLVYVDDILHISHDTEPTMKELGKLYRLKPESMGEPTRYLGANIAKYQVDDGSEKWSMSSEDYVRNAIKNLEILLMEEEAELNTSKRSTERPYPANYRPEIDVTPLLGPVLVTRYQNLIGILRWMVELGRLDIYTEVSMLSSYLCSPRMGHLKAVYSIFAYLKRHSRSRIVFDDRRVQMDDNLFEEADWTDFYGDIKEELPPNMPEPKGDSVIMTCYVDADHAGNLATRRSHTGIIIFLNNTPIQWYSRRQNTVEASTFGSEFNALRIAVEMIEALRYKLRMFGIPIDGPTNVFCDNSGVVLNSSRPDSTLTKKHNSICYHRVREAVAREIIRIAYVGSKSNYADVLTKTTNPMSERRYLLQDILY